MSKRWLPVASAIDVFRVVLVVSVNFFTPSTHTSMRASVPTMVAFAWIVTGKVTVAPLAGAQTLTPGEVGALQLPPPPPPPPTRVIATTATLAFDGSFRLFTVFALLRAKVYWYRLKVRLSRAPVLRLRYGMANAIASPG